MALMLAWSEWVTHDDFILVGASASLMGIVGASGAVSLRRYARTRSPQDRRWLFSLLLIVSVQTVFDLSTPNVSVGAHLGGVSIGFLLGLALASATPYARARADRRLAREAS
jgi:membrane associated rhomboid family serine protease